MKQPPSAKALAPDSQAAQTHLAMLQGIISRLASNSASCKTWCVTLASALAVVAADHQQTDRPKILVVAALPILLFFLLDVYYLGLERRFRNRYEVFVRKLHEATATIDDVFVKDDVSCLRVSFRARSVD